MSNTFIELQTQTLLIMLLLPLDGVLLMMVLIIGSLETPGVLLGVTMDTSKLRGVLVELVPYALPYLGKRQQKINKKTILVQL